MIRIRSFTFYYADLPEPALKDINLRINDGEFVLIAGPSGSGKSSLARCLNGLIPHFYGGKLSGQVEVEEMCTTINPPKEMSVQVGMVFQDPENQLVAADVEREIAFGLENLALPREEMAKRIEEALDTVHIAGIRKRGLHELSGGEKQKVAIASVLALKPKVLVLDEPTSELDPQGAEEVLSIIRRLNDELGLTVILIEHRLERVIHLVDRFIVMEQGRVLADGPPGEILGSNYDKLAKAGLGIPPLISLVHALQARGMVIEKMPLTVKDGRKVLSPVFCNSRKKLPSMADAPKNDSLIEVKNLWFTYKQPQAILKDVSLTVNKGEFIAIMGRNAAGKSTLIKHFNGLLKPARGKVLVKGMDTQKSTVAELARHVGFVFQNPNDHLFADTVEEELAFTLKNLGLDRIEERVNKALDRFDLQRYRKQYPRFLSGGEKQRVALASVLVAEPQVLILDEPTRGMDQKLKNSLMQYLWEYKKEGNTVIMVTHDVELVAEHAERVVLLSQGQVVVDGDRRKVLSKALLFSPQINRVVQGFEKYGVQQEILTVKDALQII